jgi:hypothetical protein
MELFSRDRLLAGDFSKLYPLGCIEYLVRSQSQLLLDKLNIIQDAVPYLLTVLISLYMIGVDANWYVRRL